MNSVDRWLLPDGIGDVLPEQARQIECLRRRLLDLYSTWGYELVIPPLIEFTESLLVGAHRDLDLQTFKVTDQVSGRLMGIRADITPQAARIDAHGLGRNAPVRLCYADTVLRTRPATALSSRAPLQVGVECFGIAGCIADCEVISLMIETLLLAEIDPVTVSLGHVGIVRGLGREAGLNDASIAQLHDILQRKAQQELAEFSRAAGLSDEAWHQIEWLLAMQGDRTILVSARQRAGLPADVYAAIDELDGIAGEIAARYPQVRLHIDLAEAPGYHYHSGIVFAAYTDKAGASVANGGRYDGVSEVYGRPRAATGFNADIKTLVSLSRKTIDRADAIMVRQTADRQQWQAVQALRAAGERVVCVDPRDAIDTTALGCQRELVIQAGHYMVKPCSIT